MYYRQETDKARLFNLLWKNSTDAYLQPEAHSRGYQVPSLIWFCLQCLAEFPDQVQLPLKLIYRPSKHQLPESYRVVDEIFEASTAEIHPGEKSNKSREYNLSRLDPCLWAIIIQIFQHIPYVLRTYTIPLNDDLLPILQGLNNTNEFSLITILELPGCRGLTDDNISDLRCLHTLAAFDASNTTLSSHGIMSLTRTLLINGSEEPVRKLRGPWGLRILRMKHCARIDNTIYPILSNLLPLLSIVDLRGTKCQPPVTLGGEVFSTCKDRRLFSCDLGLSLDILQQKEEDIQVFSAPKQYQFTLRIKSLCHENVSRTLDLQHAVPPTHRREAIFPWQPGDRGEEHCSEFEGSSSNSEEENDRICPSSRDGDQESWTEYVEGDGSFSLAASMWESKYAGVDQRPPTLPSEGRSDISHRKKQEASISPRASPSQTLRVPFSVESDSHNQRESNGFSSRLLVGATRSRKLYWYDADRYRAGTYVPLSLARGEFDEDLMLYRPTRPWNWLESELAILVEKEAKRESARAKRSVPVISSVDPMGRKRLKVQEGLESMAALAIQRRQVDNSRTRDDLSQRISKNPFTKK